MLLRGGRRGTAPALAAEEPGRRHVRGCDHRRGLGEPIATRSAAWGDYDNDGWVDLFVCGEYGALRAKMPTPQHPTRATAAGCITTGATARFADVAAGRGGRQRAMLPVGAAWGDYDDDGRLDLYVSNRDGPGRLYHNEGDGTFRDVAAELGVAGPELRLFLLVLGL